MYEVAVLRAGSAGALELWMKDHGYRYPDGMEAVCQEYVDAKWCFVAVKARVGTKGGADPRPGQRAVDNGLPEGAEFTGAVQAMGFRFRSRQLVVPMRLSTFNEGDLRNVVFLLADSPAAVRHVPPEFVRRQVPGSQLVQNLRRLLPVRVIGGTARHIPGARLQRLKAERNPAPHNGGAGELFAADLEAVRRGTLVVDVEREARKLHEIGEALGLRGREYDRSVHDAQARALACLLPSERAQFGIFKCRQIDLELADFAREIEVAHQRFTLECFIVSDLTQLLYTALGAGNTRDNSGN